MAQINIPVSIASLTEAQIYEKFALGRNYQGAKTPKEFLQEQIGLIIQNAIFDADINTAKETAIQGIIRPDVVVDGQAIPKVEIVAEEIINP